MRWPAPLKYGMLEGVEALHVSMLRTLRELAGTSVLPCCVRSTDAPDDKRRMAEAHNSCEVQWNAATTRSASSVRSPQSSPSSAS